MARVFRKRKLNTEKKADKHFLEMLTRKTFFLPAQVLYGTKAFGIGRSPDVPNVVIAVPPVERWMNQFAVAGRKTAGSNLPSPS